MTYVVRDTAEGERAAERDLLGRAETPANSKQTWANKKFQKCFCKTKEESQKGGTGCTFCSAKALFRYLPITSPVKRGCTISAKRGAQIAHGFFDRSQEKKYLPGDGALARDRASLALLPGPRPAKGEAGACDPTTYRRYLPAAVVYGFCFALARRDTLDFSLVHYFVLRVRLSSPARAQNFVELVPTMCSTGVRLYETVSVRRRWVPSPLTRGQQGCV